MIIALLASMLSGPVAPDPETWRCFDLTYPGVAADEAGMYPYRLALEGVKSGAVVSRAAGDDSRFWWMFRNVGARWSRRMGDSLSVSFNNGFTWVSFDLVLRGDSLLGNGVIHYDFGDPKTHPRFTIAGKLSRCEPVDLKGPERDPEALREARERDAWAEFQESERRRVSALELPFVGAWRFVVDVPGAGPVTLFGRTTDHPFDIDNDILERDTADYDLSSRKPAVGYQVPMVVARDSGALDARDFRNDHPPTMTAGFSVLERPLLRSQDSTVWQAQSFLVQALSRLVTSEKGDGRPWSAASRSFHEVWWDGLPGKIEGAIVVRRDGTVSYRAVAERAGRIVVRVTGERIGAVTLGGP